MDTKTSRRSFLKLCTAAGTAQAFGWTAWAQEPASGEVYPGWKPGEMDLHFIYTGCGENMFYRLPDGTSILNDTGDIYRPRDLKDVPLLPNDSRLGGDWVARYLKRVYPESTIDYALFSHWHSDHIGYAGFSERSTPDLGIRFRTTADGRKINGFLCVAEAFKFRRYMDHQYPARGTYGTHDLSMKLLAPWVEEQRQKGLQAEAFHPGALNQIALQRDPAKYKDLFSVRNICANGVLWDGRTGTVDYAAEHVRHTTRRLTQNMLSMAFVIQYGKFKYFTSGDIQSDGFIQKDGTMFDYEGRIGELVGPVSLCKMSHHGCTNAMGASLLKGIHAQTYTSCMWCPSQAHPIVLDRLVKASKNAGEPAPLLVPNLVCSVQAKGQKKYGYKMERLGAAHVVVKVLPGGNDYRVYLLDATDESMRVLAKFDRRA